MAAASSKGVSRATSTGLSSALDDLLDILEDDDVSRKNFGILSELLYPDSSLITDDARYT